MAHELLDGIRNTLSLHKIRFIGEIVRDLLGEFFLPAIQFEHFYVHEGFGGFLNTLIIELFHLDLVFSLSVLEESANT